MPSSDTVGGGRLAAFLLRHDIHLPFVNGSTVRLQRRVDGAVLDRGMGTNQDVKAFH